MEEIIRRLLENKKLLESEGYTLLRINEMAEPLDKIRRDLKSNSREVILHLLKIYYWGYINQGTKDYWIKEIPGKLKAIPLIKGKNSYMKEEAIIKIIWEAWGDTQLAFQKEMNGDPSYLKFPRVPDISEEAMNFCKEYIIWLAHELAEAGVIIKKKLAIL